MGRPKGSKNSGSGSASKSGANKAIATVDSTMTPSERAEIQALKPRRSRVSTPRGRNGSRKPRALLLDASSDQYGLLFGTSKSIKKLFSSASEALEHVKTLPVQKQTKAKLVTIQALKVETTVLIAGAPRSLIQITAPMENKVEPTTATVKADIETVLANATKEYEAEKAKKAVIPKTNMPPVTFGSSLAENQQVIAAAREQDKAARKSTGKKSKITPVVEPPATETEEDAFFGEPVDQEETADAL